MPQLLIIERDGQRIEIDETPVRRLVDAVENNEPGAVTDVIVWSTEMSKEQLRLAVVELASMCISRKRLADWLMTEQGLASSSKLVELARAANGALWPELLNGDKQ